jgi:hypothetical protein
MNVECSYQSLFIYPSVLWEIHPHWLSFLTATPTCSFNKEALYIPQLPSLFPSTNCMVKRNPLKFLNVSLSQSFSRSTWPVLSKPLVNPQVARRLANSWPPKPLARVPRPLEESRNPIVIVPVPSLFMKFVVTKSRLSF